MEGTGEGIVRISLDPEGGRKSRGGVQVDRSETKRDGTRGGDVSGGGGTEGETEVVGYRSGERVLLLLASTIIVIAGLKAAAGLLVPVLFAALLSLACTPAIHFLERRRVPSLVAMTLVAGGIVVIFVSLAGLISSSVERFQEQIPHYRSQYEVQREAWDERISSWSEGFGGDSDDVEGSASVEGEDDGAAPGTSSRTAKDPDTPEAEANPKGGSLLNANPDQVWSWVASTANGVLGLVSNLLIVLLTMVFILLEMNGFPAKLRRALGDPEADLSGYAEVTQGIYGYLSMKTLVSVLTGLLVTVMIQLVGCDFAFLWGLVAFLFNYIPNVGSILAAIPAVLLAWLDRGQGIAWILVGGYVSINMLIGNLLEPRLMGKRLGLSPLVVLLSLMFWSWVWGPMGMILSLPMTMVIKIALEHSEDLHFVAVLLGPVESDTDGEAPDPAAVPVPSERSPRSS